MSNDYLQRDSSGIFATQLTILAKVLFLSYLVLSLGELFPPRLLNPEWQLHAINQLLQTAVAPLLGLAFIHGAYYLNPTNPRIGKLRERVGRLAILASLGFLLLVPLHASAALQRSEVLAAKRMTATTQGTEQLRQMRQAVRSATSFSDLQQRMRRLNAPEMAGDLNRPLDQIRPELLAELDRGERILVQEAQRQAALQGPLPLTAVSVRTMLLALIFAVGFASGAQRRYSHVPLLQELTQARGRLRWPQGHGPRNGARHRPLQDAYLLPPEDGEWGEQNGAPR